MNKDDESYVRIWVRANAGTIQNYWWSPAGMSIMDAQGPRITGWGATDMGMIREMQSGKKALFLQPQRTHRLRKQAAFIRKIAMQEGMPVITLTAGVSERANIRQTSIELIDERPAKATGIHLEPTQLIRATVVVPGERTLKRDAWGLNFWSYAKAIERESFFVSGHDDREGGPSFFFCELPPGSNPTTADEGLDCLRPGSVLLAETQNMKIKRQGDMFFIRQKGYEPEYSVQERAMLHQSNHRADEVTIDGNLTYVRGTIKHVPDRRRADHKPLYLGRRHWWLCVQNAVPVTR